MTTSELKKNFDEFFATFNGASVEVVDSNAKNQCVDLAVAFADWLGLSRQTNAQYYAYQIYTNTPAYVLNYMDKIPNTSDYVPQKGDFVIWKKEINGTAGHIGIANGVGDTNKFQSFDQNWSSAQRVSQVINHNYDHVWGALRLKTTGDVTSSPTPNMPTAFEVKKSGAVDKLAIWLVEIKEATDSGTEQYFDNAADPDEFVNKIKSVYAKAKQSAQPVDTSKIKEEGRQLGLKQVKDAANAVK